MQRKKKPAEPAPDEKELIDRIDALMDLKRPAQPLAPAANSSQPIDIFKDLKTKPPIIIEQPVPESPEVPTVPEAAPPPEAPAVVEDGPDVAEVSTDIPVAKLAQTSKEEDEFDDDKTDQAVDEIILADSDELLVSEDIVAKTAPPLPPKRRGLLGKLFE